MRKRRARTIETVLDDGSGEADLDDGNGEAGLDDVSGEPDGDAATEPAEGLEERAVDADLDDANGEPTDAASEPADLLEELAGVAAAASPEERARAAADLADQLVARAESDDAASLTALLRGNPRREATTWRALQFRLGDVSPSTDAPHTNPCAAVLAVARPGDGSHVASELVAIDADGSAWTALVRTDDELLVQVPSPRSLVGPATAPDAVGPLLLAWSKALGSGSAPAPVATAAPAPPVATKPEPVPATTPPPSRAEDPSVAEPRASTLRHAAAAPVAAPAPPAAAPAPPAAAPAPPAAAPAPPAAAPAPPVAAPAAPAAEAQRPAERREPRVAAGSDAPARPTTDRAQIDAFDRLDAPGAPLDRLRAALQADLAARLTAVEARLGLAAEEGARIAVLRAMQDVREELQAIRDQLARLEQHLTG